MKRLVVLLLGGGTAWGQCVMCFRTAAAQNAARAHVLNMGIALLGIPPFCILAAFLVLAWRRNRAYAEAAAAPVDSLVGQAVSPAESFQ